MSRSIVRRSLGRGTQAVHTWAGYLYLLIVCALTALMVCARDYLLLTDVVTLYLLVIMIGAFRFSRGVSIAIAALSVAASLLLRPSHLPVRSERQPARPELRLDVHDSSDDQQPGVADSAAGARRAGARGAGPALYALTTELAAAVDDGGVAGSRPVTRPRFSARAPLSSCVTRLARWSRRG